MMVESSAFDKRYIMKLLTVLRMKLVPRPDQHTSPGQAMKETQAFALVNRTHGFPGRVFSSLVATALADRRVFAMASRSDCPTFVSSALVNRQSQHDGCDGRGFPIGGMQNKISVCFLPATGAISVRALES